MTKIALRLFHTQNDAINGNAEVVRVGKKVAGFLMQSLPHGVSGREAQGLVNLCGSTGGHRTPDEQALINFIGRHGVDKTSEARIGVDSGRLLKVWMTQGRTGGAEVIKQEISGPDSVELETRARLMWQRDAGVQERPVSSTIAQYLESLGATDQSPLVEAVRTEFLQASVDYLNKEIRRAEAEQWELPDGLAGHTVTTNDLVNGFEPLNQLFENWDIACNTRGEIVQVEQNGKTLGSVFEWTLRHDMDSSTWSLIWDSEAKAFTAKANTHDWPQAFELLT